MRGLAHMNRPSMVCHSFTTVPVKRDDKGELTPISWTRREKVRTEIPCDLSRITEVHHHDRKLEKIRAKTRRREGLRASPSFSAS
jgi:hypothetical protein